MKKLNLFLVLVVSIFLFNIEAKAETFEYNYGFNDSYFGADNFLDFTSYFNNHYEIITRLYDMIFEEYNANYSEDYPYYHLTYFREPSYNNDNKLIYTLYVQLSAYYDVPYFYLFGDNRSPVLAYNDSEYIENMSDNYIRIEAGYNLDTSTYIPAQRGTISILPSYMFNLYSFYETFYIDSNFDIKLVTEREEDSIIIHDYRNTGTDLILKNGDTFPTLFKNSNITNFNYTEINLNDYAYIALSLKNYNQEPFSTNVYVKGNYCLTPVYNYGMTERKDILTGTQVQRCSPYYNDYTPVRTYIIESDLKNHAIYYLKAYDTSKDNYVKIDTSVFDITYITEEKSNYPYVTIDGKTYPTIPYDDLTDTSTKSEDDGYNSGTSCAVGDFNCMTSSSTSSFSDLFDKPLEVLKSIWSSITSVFSLITYLISLLPSEMATFLYLGFTLAIVIGLIKIIL